MSNFDQAFRQAAQICSHFNYVRVVSEPSAGVEVWRCRGKGFDHAHDLIITPMGITAMGDMDPLVFRTANRDVDMLATADLDYLYRKLDESCRRTGLDEVALYRGIRDALAPALLQAWGACDGDFAGVRFPLDLLAKWRDAEPEACQALFSQLVDALEPWLHASREARNAAQQALGAETGQFLDPTLVADHLGQLESELGSSDDIRHVWDCVARASDDLRITIFEGGDDYEMLLQPHESVLRRLAILSLGAKKILEIRGEADSSAESSNHRAMRPGQ